MTTRDLTGVFLLNLANRDFALGKGPFPCRDSPVATSFMSAGAKIALWIGAAATLATLGSDLYEKHVRESLIASVRSVTASVSGCEGPGRYQHVRFHYTVDGKPYDQNAYWQLSIFIGGSGLTDACAAGTVKLNYLAGEPGRWAIAPLSPIKRDELQSGISGTYRSAGPAFLVASACFGLTAFRLRKDRAQQERLRDFGVVLEAELVKARLDDGDGSPYSFLCEYRFRNPTGLGLIGKTRGFQKGIQMKDLPLPGTRMLVLYVDHKLHQAL